MANTNLTTLFSNIANAIRGKDGSTGTIAASDFADRITAIPTGATLKTGTFKGNGTRTVTITLEDNVDDIILFNCIKASGSLVSAVFGVYFDKDGNNYSIVANSSAVSNYSAIAVTVTKSGNALTLTCSTSYTFKTNLDYNYYYAV